MAETPKGYWIVRADVHDADAYAAYIAANGEAFAAHGGRFLVRGPAEAVEGSGRARNVVIEFPSVAAARACHASDAYQAAAALRAGAAEVDIVIAEGYDGPQPAGA
jgi:uncharacterized protein (DUF1330 family)